MINDQHYLKQALEKAEESVKKGGFPAGAVIVKDGKVVGEGISLGFVVHDPTSHAEIDAIRKASKKLQSSDLSGSTLYETLECCTMCFSASCWAGISRIVYSCKKTPEMILKQYYEGNISNTVLNNGFVRKIELEYIPDLNKEALELVSRWENKNIQY